MPLPPLASRKSYMNQHQQDTPFPGGRQGPIFYPRVFESKGLLRPTPIPTGGTQLLHPVRNLRVKKRSKSGYVPFQHLGRCVWYESELELNFLQILKFAEEPIGVLEQPLTISKKALGFGRGIYTPDFLIWKHIPYQTPMDIILVEIKYIDDIKKNNKTICPRLDAGRVFAEQNGWKFLLITDRDLRIANPKPDKWDKDRTTYYHLRNTKKIIGELFAIESSMIWRPKCP